MQPSTPPDALPQWFFPLFALSWLAISALLSLIGGWHSLAQEFRAEDDGSGERFYFVSGGLGARFAPVSYRGCLFVTVGDRGIRLSIFFLFRFLSPPLFIPWEEVSSVEERRFLFFRHTVIHLRDRWQEISLVGKAARCVQEVFARVRVH
jgi:hypothetical protein